MKRLYNAAASVRSLLFCQSRTGAAASKMDPILRSALAETIQEQDVTNELQQIEAEIAQAEAALKISLEKEKFLGLRSRQYRKALDARAFQLKQERAASPTGNGDEEQALADWEARMEKWEQDEDALQSVIKTHKQIVANCEQMRRDIKELHKKKARISNMNDQCQDFVELADAGNNDNDPNQLELSPLVDDDDDNNNETQPQSIEAIEEERDVEAPEETKSLIAVRMANDGAGDAAQEAVPSVSSDNDTEPELKDTEESGMPATSKEPLEKDASHCATNAETKSSP